MFKIVLFSALVAVAVGVYPVHHPVPVHHVPVHHSPVHVPVHHVQVHHPSVHHIPVHHAPVHHVPVEHHAPQPYAFGYRVKDHHGEQYREESGDGHSGVKGSYGFTDARGIHRQVNYVADHAGFRAEVKTNEPGTANQDPAAVKMISSAPYGGSPAYGGLGYGIREHGPVHGYHDHHGHGYRYDHHGYDDLGYGGIGYDLRHSSYDLGNGGIVYGLGYGGYGYGHGYTPRYSLY